MVAPIGNFGFWAMVSLFFQIARPIVALQSLQPRIRIGLSSNGMPKGIIQAQEQPDPLGIDIDGFFEIFRPGNSGNFRNPIFGSRRIQRWKLYFYLVPSLQEEP